MVELSHFKFNNLFSSNRVKLVVVIKLLGICTCKIVDLVSLCSFYSNFKIFS